MCSTTGKSQLPCECQLITKRRHLCRQCGAGLLGIGVQSQLSDRMRCKERLSVASQPSLRRFPKCYPLIWQLFQRQLGNDLWMDSVRDSDCKVRTVKGAAQRILQWPRLPIDSGQQQSTYSSLLSPRHGLRCDVAQPLIVKVAVRVEHGVRAGRLGSLLDILKR
jgi:hypothetical protein